MRVLYANTDLGMDGLDLATSGCHQLILHLHGLHDSHLRALNHLADRGKRERKTHKRLRKEHKTHTHTYIHTHTHTHTHTHKPLVPPRRLGK